jgi:hypothetical protein
MSGDLTTILSAELATIDEEMRTDIKGYTRSPEKRARHLHLLEQVEAAQSPARSPNPVAAWHERAEVDAVERSRGHAGRILAAFAGEPDQGRAFKSRFEGLPSSVQSACFDEMSRYKPGFVKNASDAELAGVRDGLAGGEGLIAAWGWKAREKLGRALDAVERVEKSLSPADLREFKGWFSRIPARERVLLLWGAAG